MLTQHVLTPLHITGNTTPEQQDLLHQFLRQAVAEASEAAIEKLDHHTAQIVLDQKRTLQAAFTKSVIQIVEKHTISDQYKSEEASSNREYPSTYKVRPIEAQVTTLRKHFPRLKKCMERLARRPLPEEAEGWFALPRWEALAPTYNEALEMVLDELGRHRKFSNRVAGKLEERYLRQTERSIRVRSMLAEQQPDNDIYVVAGQSGMLHRGCSARRARVLMRGNEFALGAFSFACILLTHPERLSTVDTLMVDCAGDQYSLNGDQHFDRVPLFDFDIGGLQFSIFYEDRSRNMWGSPSCFLFEMS